MIWTYLKYAILWIVRMLVPPPAGIDPNRRIRIDAKCPTCGNRGGTLKYMRVSTVPGAKNGDPVVSWTCNTCQFSCYEDVVSFHKNPAA